MDARKGAPKRSAYLLVIAADEHGGRRFVRLPDTTVLAWFRRNLSRTRKQRISELNGPVYGLESVFDNDDELDEPRHDVDEPRNTPSSDVELVDLICRTLYSEGGHEVRAHFIAVETDDDEIPIRYWFFDDEFLDQPGAWDELPDWRTPRKKARDEDEDDDEEDDGGDDDSRDEFERFYRARNDVDE